MFITFKNHTIEINNAYTSAINTKKKQTISIFIYFLFEMSEVKIAKFNAIRMYHIFLLYSLLCSFSMFLNKSTNMLNTSKLLVYNNITDLSQYS